MLVFLTCWCALAICNAFFINEENERFQHTTIDPKDVEYTTVDHPRNFEEDIDFYKGFGQWHTPTWRRKNTTLSFEDFCVKYFPQYTSTPNWDDYGTFAFTLPPNMSNGEILRNYLKLTVHSFEVEEYFREHARRTWFSPEDTWEKEEWRGWTTTVFPPDLMVYNPNATWADVEKLRNFDEDHTLPDLGLDLDYGPDELLKEMHRQKIEEPPKNYTRN
ncbi:uncharacterized protein LOC103511991 isoform X3 [Diaphorina citri]|jgi:hypothetical protein|uniref:Uncharacterized protein LOC103511991 isoform X3 n=1 Tax=Diaphorina citri TaxID=121845 RepID=A0A1S3D601_DIACI|nr:uncharacterized protein LOC103511991 isoform X3 [Diaphorina citri]KAI5699912.1 hypothetical protein M8J75_011004 [Diaphorina citri]KAI5726497.1 hypothetical protein M8J76_003745 [Diaphorina citri]KAI5730797.1 hypothetical protein M8J77_000041 [Diaphorina citri]